MKIVIEKIDWFVARFVSLLMALLVVDVTWQVLSRFVFNNPSTFTEEVALFLVLWIALLGAAYTYRQGAHLGLDILVEKLEEGKRLLVQRLADIACLAFALILLVYGGWELVLLNVQLEQTSAALQMQIWIVYSVIPISGILISLYALERIIYGPLEKHVSPEEE